MASRPGKTGVFVVEGLNSLSLAFYFLFLFFFMQEKFGFGNVENLLLGGYAGFLYMISSFVCGKTSRRIGLYNCLTGAFCIIPVALLIGAWTDSMIGHVLVFTVSVLCMGFVWAPLQALACQGEAPERVQRLVGIYNVVWATVVAGGYFVAGAMFEAWDRSIFVVTACIVVLQLLIVLYLRRRSRRDRVAESPLTAAPSEMTVQIAPKNARAFLRMAWIANPFAFVAANVCMPTIPTIADRMGMSPTYAGIFCSVWLFSRAAGFVLCWQWTGWHYQLRWLLTGYLVLIVSFAAILTVPNLLVLIIAQLFFGLALGLLYYSSLYYSMHVDVERQGENGGIHESVIGAGNCAGPLCGAAALYLFPAHPNASAWAVSTAMLLGLLWIVRIWLRRS